MNPHVSAVLNDLEIENVSSLLLIQELSEDVRSLGVGLAPSIGFRIEELETKDTLSNLVHDRGPKQDIDLAFLPIEQSVDIRELA